MKTMKKLIAVLLVVTLLFSLAGCTVIMPQRMYRVKGTYRLTQYSVTPAGNRNATATDYVAGEAHLYEDYLIVTGEATGYYVHRAAGAEATVTAVTLSYRYEDGSKKIEYVSYGNTEEESPLGGITLSVARDSLSYTKLAIGYTEPFTGRELTTEGITVRFERVSRKTDLDYVEEALGVHFTVE